MTNKQQQKLADQLTRARAAWAEQDRWAVFYHHRIETLVAQMAVGCRSARFATATRHLAVARAALADLERGMVLSRIRIEHLVALEASARQYYKVDLERRHKRWTRRKGKKR